ncbi:MAG: FAD-binding oxidoreductase [Actinomycetota bacterium]|nr:FAD-binding oxidoreductase [Actinomycetota bacterium]
MTSLSMVDSVASAHPATLWLDRLDPPLRRRPGLGGGAGGPDPLEPLDVAIVGGGFSGLWTAYYLARLDPGKRIVVIEREVCGFGASGRNGGWCEGELAGSFEAFAARSSPSEALRQARAAFDAVDEVGRVCVTEHIDAHFQKGGTVRVARTAPQAERQRAEVSHHRRLGFTEEEVRLLDVAEATALLGATRVRSGIFLAPSAALDPARLVRGLAETVERLGVTIYEGTEVVELEPGWVRVRATGREHASTTRLRAGVVVRSTEAYTRDLPGMRRHFIPVYSLMIATEPLSDDVFGNIGLTDRPTFADDRYLVIYGQRTADNRLAFGGRGVPYLFGSRIRARTEQNLRAHRLIASTLADLLPAVSEARITHRWGGVLAIPRNWMPFVRYDPSQGRAELGGYVGEGVAASNLAGRTLAELICGHDTERTSLPIVGVKSRDWEPEPLRWLGVRSSRRLLMSADRFERATDRPATAAVRAAQLLRDPFGPRP